MGQRANLIVVENGKYQIFYSHWCANTLTSDLFWGPGHALNFIRRQRLVDESGWLDDIWAEGAAVVDCDKRVLLLYGGEDVYFDVALREVYLELLRRVWTPWEVRWAFEGIASIADYVAYPRAHVLSKRQDEDEFVCSLAPPQDTGWTDIVGSIRFPDRIRLYPLAGDVLSYLLAGPDLLQAPGAESGLERFSLEEASREFPTGGFHIDLPARTIEFWIARDEPNAPLRISRRWPGWMVYWHMDDYKFQAERTKASLRFPVLSRELLEQRIVRQLMADIRSSGAELIASMVEKERSDRKTVEVNPWALRDDRIELSPDCRRQILAAALGRPVGPIVTDQ